MAASIDLDSVVIEFHAGFFEMEPIDVRLPADRRQYRLTLHRAALVKYGHPAVRPFVDPGGEVLEHESYTFGFQHFLELAG